MPTAALRKKRNNIMQTTHYAIALGRQLGSGGKAIGERLAKALSIPIYDNRLLSIAAKESGFNTELFEDADELSSSGASWWSGVIHNITSPFSNIGNIYSSSVSRESLFHLQSKMIYYKAKEEDCIIVGRCADYTLRTHPRLLKVFIHADLDDRIRFIAERHGVSEDKARQLIARSDRQRAEYHDFYCETNWGECRTYDICLNSSVLGIDGTAEVLLDYARKALCIGGE